MDVDKCIPQDVIIDTGAVSVMLSTKFAKVVCVNFSTLNLGPEFVIAEGKVVAATRARCTTFPSVVGTPPLRTTPFCHYCSSSSYPYPIVRSHCP